ncbi:hypothetical protein W911_03510 [Hyphomicrobium nitrativorans NL23]|uniref:Uncharacterized protein n=1 Tax=Hyphomicrobium nitrativorans NL23 TaxID=1029756 RepID=V5SIJ8_9HYPH|nr:hypothetical protein [Hyphomicrobium nitrativorans]AHB49890.1 hypothetical protein W911_03510 [Hyphomicrobium nitrativorans NL23]
MPRFYEEAAHLLLIVLTHGVVLGVERNHLAVLYDFAGELDRVMAMRRSHADTAEILLDSMILWGFFDVPPDRRKRLLAIIGTFIGNLMTIRRPAA